MAWKVIDSNTGREKFRVEEEDEDSSGLGIILVALIGLCMVIGLVLAGLDYLGEKTENLINKVYPAYETSSERDLKEKQRCQRWEQFISNPDQLFETCESSLSLPGKIKACMDISIPEEKIVEFCRRWKINELIVLDSTWQVYVGVTVAPDAPWSIDRYTEMKDELKILLGRKEVNLVTRQPPGGSHNPIRR